MSFSIIVAVNKNGVIGKEGGLPWSLSDDLNHFKKITWNHTVIMGRKTYYSIPRKFRPLKDRKNIIITRNEKEILDVNNFDNVEAYSNVDNIISRYKETLEEVFVIGGESIYKRFLPYTKKIYLTIVDSFCLGDAFFPWFDTDMWEISERNFHSRDEVNECDFEIRILKKKESSTG